MPYHVVISSTRPGRADRKEGRSSGKMSMTSKFTCRNEDLLTHMRDEIELAATNKDQITSITVNYEEGF